MGLYWLTFKRSGRLAGVAIVLADTLVAPQMRAAAWTVAVRGMFEEGHLLDPETAAGVPENCIGRLLSLREAADLLERIQRSAGKVK